MNVYPHCDASVLHKPGICEFCDRHPDWQELRVTWGIAFTGEKPVGDQVLCPAERRRPIDAIERWGGNVATTGRTLNENRILAGLWGMIRDLGDPA